MAEDSSSALVLKRELAVSKAEVKELKAQVSALQRKLWGVLAILDSVQNAAIDKGTAAQRLARVNALESSTLPKSKPKKKPKKRPKKKLSKKAAAREKEAEKQREIAARIGALEAERKKWFKEDAAAGTHSLLRGAYIRPPKDFKEGNTLERFKGTDLSLELNGELPAIAEIVAVFKEVFGLVPIGDDINAILTHVPDHFQTMAENFVEFTGSIRDAWNNHWPPEQTDGERSVLAAFGLLNAFFEGDWTNHRFARLRNLQPHFIGLMEEGLRRCRRPQEVFDAAKSVLSSASDGKGKSETAPTVCCFQPVMEWLCERHAECRSKPRLWDQFAKLRSAVLSHFGAVPVCDYLATAIIANDKRRPVCEGIAKWIVEVMEQLGSGALHLEYVLYAIHHVYESQPLAEAYTDVLAIAICDLGQDWRDFILGPLKQRRKRKGVEKAALKKHMLRRLQKEKKKRED